MKMIVVEHRHSRKPLKTRKKTKDVVSKMSIITYINNQYLIYRNFNHIPCY